ncbi:MAG: glycosyltransferase [Ignavibacteriales bacterium]|nr:MAG: glycosyltransferase [Ignavibacteriales bacterium]
MKISIITPVFNSAKSISRNVNSIVKQTHQDFEQIVIDNLSNDDTLNIIQNIYNEHGVNNKLKIISEPDSGIADAFNKGINASSGNVIAILNSDDEYYNDKVFEEVINLFKESEPSFVYGDIKFIDAIYGSNLRKPLLCDLSVAMPYNHPAMFIKKELYQKCGMYDTSFKYAMDYELIVRLEKNIPLFRDKGKYLSGQPIALMNAGGESWKNEIKGIKETRLALIKHGLWNFSAKKNYVLRISRVRIKKIIHLLGLKYLIALWRNHKWS